MTAEEVQSVYELETANVIVERFKDLDPAKMCAVLVHSHGPFVWGQTGLPACEYALALEIVGQLRTACAVVGKPIYHSSHWAKTNDARCL
jgi:L-ribulose-5-phosphate 4-epimerase